MSLRPYRFVSIRANDDYTKKNTVPFASVSVKNASGTPADVYFLESGGVPYSEFLLDSNGTRDAWLNIGDYQASIGGGQFQSFSISGVQEFTASGDTSYSAVVDLASQAKAVGTRSVTKGCLSLGDGGHGIFITEAASGTPDGFSRILLSNGNHDVLQPPFNIKHFGAKGLGASSASLDTLAIDRYFNFIEKYPSVDGTVKNGSRSILIKYGSSALNFTKGEYHYSGAGYTPINERVIVVRGESSGSSSIVINSDVHLVHPTDSSPVVNYVEFSNIKIVGGRGAFFNEKTNAGTVQHGKRVFNCIFSGYTSVAFGSIQNQDARWVINNTFFEGGNSGTPVGLLLPNEIAEADIAGCNSFAGNKYDIVCSGTGISQFVVGPNNSFFNIAGRTKAADIWIRPGASTQQGYALRFFGNRHSNENLDVTLPNFLFADADTGVATHVFSHLTTASTGFVNGVTIEGCSMLSTGNPSTASNAVGYIKSYTPKVGGLRFIDNPIGQWRPNIIEYAAGITGAQVEASGPSTNYARLMTSSKKTFIYDVINYSNVYGSGMFEYDNKFFGGALGEISQIGDDTIVPVKIHTTSSPRAWAKGASIAELDISDAAGGIKAARFTYSADQVVLAAVTYANIFPGEIIWIEADIRGGGATPLAAINLEYVLQGNATSYQITLTPKWRRVRIPVVCAAATHTGADFTIQFAARLWRVNGVTDSFDIGRVSIYHSPGPMSYSVTSI